MEEVLLEQVLVFQELKEETIRIIQDHRIMVVEVVKINMECIKIKVLVKTREIILEIKINHQPKPQLLKVIKSMLETLIQASQI